MVKRGRRGILGLLAAANAYHLGIGAIRLAMGWWSMRGTNITQVTFVMAQLLD